MKTPERNTISELDYTPLTKRPVSRPPSAAAAVHGKGASGTRKIPHWAGTQFRDDASWIRAEHYACLMNVAVSASLLTYPHRPPQIRQNGLEVGNDGSYPLHF